MYFPYVRGKQFELLALKEVADIVGQAGVMTPVIEPIKAPDGGLQRCFDALRNNDVEPVLIVNPSVGDLAHEPLSEEVVNFINAFTEVPWLLGVIITERTDVEDLFAQIRSRVKSRFRIALIHNGYADDLELLQRVTRSLEREYDLISDTLRRARFRRILDSSSAVIMHDGFPAQERNAAFLDREASVFNEDIVYFREEGWQGFGDYLTVGRGWSEGGFTPRAVAIHWTYEPAPGDPIIIRHFTSESNGDIANVGGKFLEAARKLVAFLDEEGIHTRAAEVMRQHLGAGTYPGLGVVKKLSIQNHLELVSGILVRNEGL